MEVLRFYPFDLGVKVVRAGVFYASSLTGGLLMYYIDSIRCRQEMVVLYLNELN